VDVLEHRQHFRRPDANDQHVPAEKKKHRRCHELACNNDPNLDDVDFATAQALETLLV
jgi:hypothetical protein